MRKVALIVVGVVAYFVYAVYKLFRDIGEVNN